MILLSRSVREYALNNGLCFFLVTWVTILKAQTPFESLSIDRPDVSNLPTTVLPGHFQFELGFEFARHPLVKEHNLPNFMFRTGLQKRSEFRFGLNYFRLDSSETRRGRALVVSTISFKYRFLEEKGFIPSIALQPDINLGFAMIRTSPRTTR